MPWTAGAKTGAKTMKPSNTWTDADTEALARETRIKVSVEGWTEQDEEALRRELGR